MLQRAAVCRSVLQCVAVCCSVLQCVAVCCSVLQCVAVCCSVFHISGFNCRVSEFFLYAGIEYILITKKFTYSRIENSRLWRDLHTGCMSEHVLYAKYILYVEIGHVLCMVEFVLYVVIEDILI